MQGEAKINWVYIPIIGVPWFFLYYFSFNLLIERFNFKTHGREDDRTETDKILTDDEQIALILSGLGGKENISGLDCCITRLRVTVKDSVQVNEELLTATGAKGMIKCGVDVQIIYGTQVIGIKNRLEEFLQSH